MLLDSNRNAAEAAAPAADPWIHGSISFIMNHIFYYEMKSMHSLTLVGVTQTLLFPLRGPSQYYTRPLGAAHFRFEVMVLLLVLLIGQDSINVST